MKTGWYWFRDKRDDGTWCDWTIVHVESDECETVVAFVGNDVLYVLTDNPVRPNGYRLHYTVDPHAAEFIPVRESAPTMPPVE